MIPELGGFSHERRLKECELTTLLTRWLRGSHTEVLKILNGYEHIDRTIFSHLRKIEEPEEMKLH